MVAYYAEDIYDEKFLQEMTPEEQQNLTLTINPQLFLEALLLEIRGKTIGYCAWKKKNMQRELNLALHVLELAERASDLRPDDDILKEKLETAKKDVHEHIQRETKAAQFRARVSWKVDGEKPSKFFCELEKFNAVQKYIPQLIINDKDGKEVLVKDQMSVDKELFNFYQNLYRSQEKNIETLKIGDFLGENSDNTPKLNCTIADQLEGLLTVEEATNYIKKCRSDASPGSSGFTGGFFKLFWRQIKHFVVNSLNHAYESGSLSVSQKLGVIVLLPKPEKDKRLLTNWRPISLLNQTYKILSGAMAERIKQVLPDIINTDQKGFVKGRFMGEWNRNTYDVIEYAKNNNRSGLLLLIDFEKAFDSISHSFIIKSLHHFGFGYSFIKWINVLLNGAESCINHSGNVTNRFKVERSCRQGDPISPYLFIICVEILALRIRQDRAVKGFNLGKFTQKLDFYADDLTAYLDGSESSLRRLIMILDEFQKISGLRINLSKCKAVWIGKNRFDKRKICTDFNLKWAHKFTLLGIDFDSDLAEMDTNFRKKLEEIKNLYKNWLYRHLTPFGRVTVIKSLAMSKLTHVVLVCPHISSGSMHELVTCSFNFLWKGKPDRLKRNEVMQPYEKGGLNMPEIQCFWDSLKLSWSRRLMSSSGVWQKILQLNLFGANYSMKDLWYGGPLLLEKMSKDIDNPFWKDTLLAFARLQTDLPFAHPHLFYHLNIFENNFFAVKGEPLKRSEFNSLWVKQVCQVGDIFNLEARPPELLSNAEINKKFGLQLDFLSYHRLKTAVIMAGEQVNHKTYNENVSDLENPRLPALQKLSCIQSKGCSIFYKTLRAKDIISHNTTKSEAKWHEYLGKIYSVSFWDHVWKITTNQYVSKRVRWLQIQINHYKLPTNYSVNKYRQMQSPLCTFCPLDQHLEKIPVLFWECPVVNSFWANIGNFLRSIFPNIELSKREALFGDMMSKPDSIINTILLLSRHYIWKQKFTSGRLMWDRYIQYLKEELTLIYCVMKFQNEPEKVRNLWGPILELVGVNLE